MKHLFWTDFFKLAGQQDKEEIRAENTTEWPVLVETGEVGLGAESQEDNV